MSEVKDYLRTTELIVNVSISIGGTVTNTLRTAVSTLKNDLSDKPKGSSLYYALKRNKGVNYSNKDKFIKRMSLSNGEIVENAVAEKQEKMFRRYCKKYGVDICIENRPEDIDAIFHKMMNGTELNEREEKLMKLFSYEDENGDMKLKNAHKIVSFDSCDLNKMDFVLDAMEEKTYSIQRRMEKVSALRSQAKDFIKDINPFNRGDR